MLTPGEHTSHALQTYTTTALSLVEWLNGSRFQRVVSGPLSVTATFALASYQAVAAFRPLKLLRSSRSVYLRRSAYESAAAEH